MNVKRQLDAGWQRSVDRGVLDADVLEFDRREIRMIDREDGDVARGQRRQTQHAGLVTWHRREIDHLEHVFVQPDPTVWALHRDFAQGRTGERFSVPAADAKREPRGPAQPDIERCLLSAFEVLQP